MDWGSRFKTLNKKKKKKHTVLAKSRKLDPVLGSGSDMKDKMKWPWLAWGRGAGAVGDGLGWALGLLRERWWK